MINFENDHEVRLAGEMLLEEWLQTMPPEIKRPKDNLATLNIPANICSLSHKILSEIFKYVPPRFANGILVRVNHAFNTAIKLLLMDKTYCKSATKSLFLEELTLKSNQQKWQKFYQILLSAQRNIFGNQRVSQLYIQTGLSGCFSALSADGMLLLKEENSQYIRYLINIKDLKEQCYFASSENVLGVFNRFVFYKRSDGSISTYSLFNPSRKWVLGNCDHKIYIHKNFIISFGKRELCTWEMLEDKLVNPQKIMTVLDTPYVIRNKRIAFKRTPDKLSVLNLRGHTFNFFKGPAIKVEVGKRLQGLFCEPIIWDISSDDKLVVKYERPADLKNEELLNKVRVWNLNNGEILYGFNFNSFKLEKRTLSLKIINERIHILCQLIKNNANPHNLKWELATGRYLGEGEDEWVEPTPGLSLEKAKTLMVSLKHFPREKDEHRLLLLGRIIRFFRNSGQLSIINYAPEEDTKVTGCFLISQDFGSFRPDNRLN